MEKHQKISIAIFFIVVLILVVRGDVDADFNNIKILFISLMTILFYKTIAHYSGDGFQWRERQASDYGSENHPGPYAFFFWCLYIAAIAVVLFR